MNTETKKGNRVVIKLVIMFGVFACIAVGALLYSNYRANVKAAEEAEAARQAAEATSKTMKSMSERGAFDLPAIK